MNTKTARNILILLLILLGFGAILGGGALIISPSGGLLGMPVTLLNNTPFSSFLVPGVILFSILGIAPVGIAVALFQKPKYEFAEFFNCYRDMYWGWTYSIYTAFSLIVWIQVEMYFLQSVHWSHTFYMLFAMAIIYVALLPRVRRMYRNKSN